MTTQDQESQASSPTGANLLDAPIVTLPKYDPYDRPTTAKTREPDPTPLRQTYDQVQESATGPGVEEWRRADRLRSELTDLYNRLRDDARYAESYKSERAWARYEEVRTEIQKLAPEAREKMVRSAQGLERLSIPTPEGESLVTKDTDKLLLSGQERHRLEGMLTRAENARGPMKRNPHDILQAEYARALDEGGPSGGAIVRAIVGLVRDWGLELDKIVDEHRRDSHRGALESAERRLIQANMVGRSVPHPPFPDPSLGGGRGSDFHTGRGASRLVNNRGVPLAARGGGHVDIRQPKNRKPSWK